MNQLKQLNDEVTVMGDLIRSSIANTVKILKSGDVSLLGAAENLEHEINAKEKDIENLCLKIMLHQHPVASDLRLVSAALKIITDMERIGDNALDIANTAKHYFSKESTLDSKEIIEMAEAAALMVEKSVTAFTKLDVETARNTIDSDDIVDDLFDKVMADLSSSYEKNQSNATSQLEILLIAKYFEKIADHAVTIAEWAEFAVTGEHK
ncbi:MAG: phosphate signaling complex protein PhoU [Oscillospiraceae bacterium]|nr:phosphate signaling complex protein PhoU [Oscillospiraceae bacterium]